MSESFRVNYVDVVRWASNFDSGSLKQAAVDLERDEPATFASIAILNRSHAIHDALFEGRPHEDVRIDERLEFEAERYDANGEYDEAYASGDGHDTDELLFIRVRTADAGVVRIALGLFRGSWGEDTGVGSVIDRVPANATVRDVCRAWCRRFEGDVPAWVSETANEPA